MDNKEIIELKQELAKETDAKVMTQAQMYDYQRALEYIREKIKNPITLSCFASAKYVMEQIEKKINEVLNENK